MPVRLPAVQNKNDNEESTTKIGRWLIRLVFGQSAACLKSCTCNVTWTKAAKVFHLHDGETHKMNMNGSMNRNVVLENINI